MGWISRAGALTTAEMENNAEIVVSYLDSQNVSRETICGILGNMENESSINPEREEVGGSGYGLVQWTPRSVLENHASALGLSPYYSGDVQLKVLISEIKGISGTNEWYSTEPFIANYYSSGATTDMIGLTPTEFLTNSRGWTADKLAIAFMVCYERPALDPAVNHVEARKKDALKWYEKYGKPYEPRLTKSGMLNSIYWYSDTNPFYPTGYGLPNCTCYAWGRFWEICGESKVPTLPTGNGGEWWDSVKGYEVGSTPKLGAVLCLGQPNGAGHVGVVEQIKENGDIVTSNSGYSRPASYDDPLYFFLDTNKKSENYVPSWAIGYYFQGFIYNPCVGGYVPPKPVIKASNIFKFIRRKEWYK